MSVVVCALRRARAEHFPRLFPGRHTALFVKGGRLTGFGRASVWAVAVLATVMLVIANFSETYTSYTP